MPMCLVSSRSLAVELPILFTCSFLLLAPLPRPGPGGARGVGVDGFSPHSWAWPTGPPCFWAGTLILDLSTYQYNATNQAGRLMTRGFS